MNQLNQEEIGWLALRSGDYQEAINLFKRNLEKRKNARNYYGLGMAYFLLGNLQKARWAFYQALQIEPDHIEANQSLSILNQTQEQRETPYSIKQVNFRVSSHYLEIYQNGKWSKFFFKGVNIGLGLPGYFPGEFPIEKGTYLKWFEKIHELGANSIRIYTPHPPSFYEALYQFNRYDRKLYLFQGIWVELPKDHNFYEVSYLQGIREIIRNTVDAIYGNTHLSEKTGYASGPYRYDVSSVTVAFIFGREWESCTVKRFNELNSRQFKKYQGNFLWIEQAQPFEVWITEMLDYLQNYEEERYGLTHPVSAINWPTLDPLIHPMESTYEENLEFQGIKVNRMDCHENEDEEILDLAKVKILRGNGFFATYHVYPYYPDFMVNEYLEAENPFLAYLLRLKDHHGHQPILIGEFGVPSSREIAHWHHLGWHHGGHSEVKQGEINSLLIQAIHQAKIAGGLLFSWFDEWYKKNWLFLHYYHPSDRKPLWYNIQDAEENFGLLGVYPNYPQKKVQLAGRMEDWREGTLLYEKKKDRMIFAFQDGFDEARFLRRLWVQHDEGFLYLLIETKGVINFNQAHFLIGIDPVSPQHGEFQLPFHTHVTLPIGLKFLIHLVGKSKSRILVCKDYDKYLNQDRGEIRPKESKQGEWVIMLNKSNIRRISKDGRKFFPSRVHFMSHLRYGSLDPNHLEYNSLADFYFSGRFIEIRLPWSLLQFTDPSSKNVLWKEMDVLSKKSKGINILAFSYRPEKGRLYATPTGENHNLTDALPENIRLEDIKKYTWEEWETPTYHTYLKASYGIYKKILTGIPECME
ncbi:MAG: tetratricopeptide repeat protein [Thermodesulfobacteriota bacterium]